MKLKMITPIVQVSLANSANNVTDTCPTLPMQCCGGCLLSIERKQEDVLISRRIIMIN